MLQDYNMYSRFSMIRCFLNLKHLGDRYKDSDGFSFPTFFDCGVIRELYLIFYAVSDHLITCLNRIYKEAEKVGLVRFINKMEHFRA